ncbi:MAG: Chemotaxis protein CheA [Synergistetes bacterium ADurb.Bin520]|nr:MAG: Chemotaxis protein CheA [Synergistetes bacterium ADurb.Bin520]
MPPSSGPAPSPERSAEAPTSRPLPAGESSSKGGGDNIRVATAKVDSMVDMLGELLITQSQIEQEAVRRFGQNDPLVTHLGRLSRITKELQGLSMSLSMVSLKSTFQKLRRLGRDTMASLGKEVDLQFVGEDTEIDRGVAEKLLDPLVHLLKNAISHGVEDEKTRLARGKPPRGTVTVSAYSRRGSVFIEVRDDGGGIDPEKVLRKAVERGLVEPGGSRSEDEVVSFIFLPGFSTAGVVDGVSGRGVGMDVVKTEISRIGGRVDVHNTPGQGCAFVLKIPINMAILNGTIVDIGGIHYILPTLAVKQILQVTDDLWVSVQGRDAVVRVRDRLVSVIPVGEVLGRSFEEGREGIHLALVLELDNRVKALPVRSVVGRQEIVVKPLNEAFRSLDFVSGASILGDGRVSLILDVEALFKYGGEVECRA